MDTKPKSVRCAVYTRKSSDEGLDQQFTSLDAQREACESYIAAQKSLGWVCLPDRYDDGGYSGGNAERPGLKRLLADIEAGKADAVVVYKTDRLSRSLIDFARIMDLFEKKGVSFVSTTQQFSTATSMGRMVLNPLMTFAVYERDLASERTRDKVAASRRRGIWPGGHTVLGYDAVDSRLVVNEAEAEQVRALFEKYLQTCSITQTVAFAHRKRWTTKRLTTKAGKPRGGRAIDKPALYKLLKCVLYVGLVPHKGQVYPAQHPAIIDRETFDAVQQALTANGETGGMLVRNTHGALLKGLIRCAACDRSMGHIYTTKNKVRLYRYYRCQALQKGGADACPSGSIPAEQVERIVVDRLRAVGDDPNVRAGVLVAVRGSGAATAAEVDDALADFDGLWASLTPAERVRAVRLLVRRIDYDAAGGTLRVEFHEGAPAGVAAADAREVAA